ncbi:MAG TPA: 1-acyl-sn-glycerol-3-phosphate acyltransferase, partial [Holophaga sp.]|nr:1-acyl-sn-glycerol-3-phosphate acyltransferase [Holophaga sp.]
GLFLPQGQVRLSAPTPVPALRLAGILGATAWTAASLPLASHHPRVPLHRWSRCVLRQLRVELDLRGTVQHEPPLWVANHLSWLDPLVLFSLRPSGALTKREVGDYPAIGPAIRRLGLAFVDREDPLSRAAAVTRLAAELRSGRPMVLFPEGTTTCGQGLAPLYEGGLRTAYRCGTTVQALRFSSEDHAYPWTGDDSLIPHLMNLARSQVTHVRLEVRDVLEPRHFPSEDAWIDAIRRQLAPHP